MSLKLYNDLTRKKEPFTPIVPGKVTFYSCGPTVYDYFHIGNSRPFIVFDVLRRYMESTGLEVIFVQNFTDVDDKMIGRANDLGITVSELAEKTIKDYFEDADALGIKRATYYPKATEHIEEIISLVKKLVETGHAYEVNGDVYFEVSTFAEYGKLSKQTIEELQSGARINVDERKKDPLDFALWKAQKPGEPAWDSPWGMGRPGWHIECSAMSMKYLGNTIDIHSGGCDLTFPHHENEIAQAEAATGKDFVKYWIHNGFLLIDKEKMSKSLGNFLTARAAREKFSPLAIRLFMLSAHYRSPINFSEETLEQAKSAVERLLNCWSDLQHAKRKRDTTNNENNKDLLETIDHLFKKYTREMDDDFNTAGALGYVFDLVKLCNNYLKDNETLSLDVIDKIESFFLKIDNIMGIMGLNRKDEQEDSFEIERLVSERNKARADRDYSRADQIRNELAEKGIILEDTPEGTKWKKEI